jgi:signal transduction histidine kinase
MVQLMTSFRKKFQSFAIKYYDRLEQWRWVVILCVGLGLFSAEVIEFIQLSFLNQPLHIFEVFLYAILLICTGLFLELFVRLNRVQKRMAGILEYKHEVGLELTLISDWDTLTAKLAQLPGRIVKAEEAYLLVCNLVSGKFETLSRWADDQPAQPAEIWDPILQCPRCFEKTPEDRARIHLCRNDNETASYFAYSLGIPDGNFPFILLKFRLKPGLELSSDEEEILLNVSDEIAVALRVGRDRKRISELQSVEVAMAERRMMSAYVHDQLGQNLGYLHLKLDQLGTNENMVSSKEIRKDLISLRKVANDSYEIVRDILKKIQPETVPHLTNLLKEHASKVSQKANLTLEFNSHGKPIQLSSDTQQAIFYAFHEILSNVEKHSKASIVKVSVIWSDAFLDISVADNGIGFHPASVSLDEHFGLEILQERIARLKGQLTLNSSPESGTLVSISVPF